MVRDVSLNWQRHWDSCTTIDHVSVSSRIKTARRLSRIPMQGQNLGGGPLYISEY